MALQFSAVAPVEAIKSLEARGRRLDPSFAWQEVYAETHGQAFTVAKSAGFDVLKDIYAGLEAALKEGRTAKQFADELTPLLQQKGWWGRKDLVNPKTGLVETAQLGSPRRLQLIFDVNMRVSYAAGQWASFERNRAVRPFLRYVAIMDERTRPTHALHHNVTLPIDHSHWRIWAPPCGWACRCTLQSLSQRDVDRLGQQLKFEPPIVETRPWINKVTGAVRHIPDGIDPGWDYNPGQAGYRGAVNDRFAASIASAPGELAKPAVAERVASTDFVDFMRRPEGNMPVAVLPDDLALPIGAQADVRVVAVSEETMRKQMLKHPELAHLDYVALQAVVDHATIVVQDASRSIVVLLREGTRWRYAAFKSTASGEGLFLASYRWHTLDRVESVLNAPGAKILIDRR